jgi:drug/metabolite transporter (DMT)-like permease
MNGSQFLLINSVLIAILILIYVMFYEEQENFTNLSELGGTQYLAILLFAIFTVVSSIIILELQREEVVVSGFLLTTISSLFLIAIGVMLFGESVNVVQFFGIALVVVGLYFITQYKEDIEQIDEDK